MIKSTITIWALGLSATITLTALTGCKHMPYNQPADGRSDRQFQDDKRLTKLVEEGLKEEAVYKFQGVDVKTYGRVVQISGFVDTENEKQRAEEVARRVPGVSQVVNDLIIKPAAIPTPTGQATGQRLGPPANVGTGQRSNSK